MIHPGKKIIEEIRNRGWTQKQFAILVGKKNSEVNELIKGKRNITIQRDYILSQVLGTPEKYWIDMQTDYDYELMKQKIKEEKNKAEEFEVVSDIESEHIKEAKSAEVLKETQKKEADHPENINSSLLEDKESKTNSTSTYTKERKNQGGDDIENGEDTKSKTSDLGENLGNEEKQKKKEVQKIFMNF